MLMLRTAVEEYSKVFVSEPDTQMPTAPKIQLRAIHNLRYPVRYQQRRAVQVEHSHSQMLTFEDKLMCLLF